MNSTFFRNTKGDRSIVTCHCGEGGCSHGQLELRLDRAADEPQVLVELWFRPADGFWARLSQAWQVLTARPMFCDVLWSARTCRDVATWLTQSADQSPSSASKGALSDN